MWSWRDELEQLAFLKGKTFADSARDAEWKRQHRVLLCVRVYFFLSVCVFLVRFQSPLSIKKDEKCSYFGARLHIWKRCCQIQ